MSLTLHAGGFTRTLARFLVKTFNWRLDITLPSEPKYVIIGAPHTSNWDFIFALLIIHGGGIKARWIAKDSLFKPPFGWFFYWLGGIPVNRSASNNMVAQVVEVFNKSDRLAIAIAPEGTRSKAKYWKTGFYYIAQGAGLPIAPGYVDFPSRTLGIGPVIYPTGDLRADFEKIKAFYADKHGVNPHIQSEVRLKEDA